MRDIADETIDKKDIKKENNNISIKGSPQNQIEEDNLSSNSVEIDLDKVLHCVSNPQ